MKNFKQYLEEASNARRIRRIGNRVAKGGLLQHGQAEAILRQASADPNLGGNNAAERMLRNMAQRDPPPFAPPPIATKNAMGNMMRRMGGLVNIYRGMPAGERGPGAQSLEASLGGKAEMDKISRPGGPTDAQRRAVKALKKQNRALRAQAVVKPDMGGNRPIQEDSGERAGSPEDGNTGYGLPSNKRRFFPAKNKRPTGPGTEYHMETLRLAYEAKKAAEAAAEAAKAAEDTR